MQTDKYCEKSYGSYGTLLEATDACNEDQTCKIVEDMSCDDKGFKLCRWYGDINNNCVLLFI